MKKILIALLLAIFTAMSVSSQTLPRAKDFPKYMAERTDFSVLTVDGTIWTTMPQDKKAWYVAGWLSGHLGMALMAGTTRELRMAIPDEILWLLFEKNVNQLLYEVDTYYYVGGDLEFPVWAVMYTLLDKLTWTEEDMKVFLGKSILPNTM